MGLRQGYRGRIRTMLSRLGPRIWSSRARGGGGSSGRQPRRRAAMQHLLHPRQAHSSSGRRRSRPRVDLQRQRAERVLPSRKRGRNLAVRDLPSSPSDVRLGSKEPLNGLLPCDETDGQHVQSHLVSLSGIRRTSFRIQHNLLCYFCVCCRRLGTAQQEEAEDRGREGRQARQAGGAVQGTAVWRGQWEGGQRQPELINAGMVLSCKITLVVR